METRSPDISKNASEAQRKDKGETNVKKHHKAFFNNA